MNARPDVRVDLSPWGVAGVATGPGEWVEGSKSGSARLAGGSRNPVAARIVQVAPDYRGNFRFNYPVD
jgi:hypothetical protein